MRARRATRFAAPLALLVGAAAACLAFALVNPEEARPFTRSVEPLLLPLVLFPLPFFLAGLAIGGAACAHGVAIWSETRRRATAHVACGAFALLAVVDLAWLLARAPAWG